MFFLPLFANQSPLHEDLLDSARRFIGQGRSEHYGVAVVLAQTACEVFTEQVRSQLVQKKQLSAIEEWIVSRTREVGARIDFYVALTSDSIKHDNPDWDEYMTHLKRRNAVVHQGRQVSKEEAEQSCRVIEAMIGRMERVVQELA